MPAMAKQTANKLNDKPKINRYRYFSSFSEITKLMPGKVKAASVKTTRSNSAIIAFFVLLRNKLGFCFTKTVYAMMSSGSLLL